VIDFSEIRSEHDYIKTNLLFFKTIDAYVRKSAYFGKCGTAAMAEQGPAAAFHLLEVCTHPLGTEGMLRHLQGVKCSNTSPKTIDAYVRKSTEVIFI
jgi:hypothetical protein